MGDGNDLKFSMFEGNLCAHYRPRFDHTSSWVHQRYSMTTSFHFLRHLHYLLKFIHSMYLKTPNLFSEWRL